jgi:hypothetical protein
VRADGFREGQVRSFLARRLLRSTIVAVAACGAWSGARVCPVVRAERPPSDAERIIAGLEATSARDARLVGSFTTSRTFTIVHEGRTDARVVAAMRFTAPDVKRFTVLESRGSALIRSRVINRMMAAEIEAARAGAHRRVAFTSANYEFTSVRDDGDAYIITMKPRRRDELLLKGQVWITKDGFHLKRVEGEPAKNPSFWTTHIRFVSDFEPVQGVWLHVRTVARVTIRWRGEYAIRSECGPYQLRLAAADGPTTRF